MNAEQSRKWNEAVLRQQADDKIIDMRMEIEHAIRLLENRAKESMSSSRSFDAGYAAGTLGAIDTVRVVMEKLTGKGEDDSV